MKKLMTLLVIATLAMGIAGAAQATVLANVQFGGYLTDEPESYWGAAVVGSAGDYWNWMNEEDFGPVTLKNTSEFETSVEFSFTANGTWYSTDSSGFYGEAQQALMDGYLYQYEPGWQSLVFGGLTPSATYDLYIYSQGDSGSDGRTMDVHSVNTDQWYTTNASSNASTFILGQNYLKIGVLADAFGNSTIEYQMNVGEANINGLQLTTGGGGSPVPEPGTILAALSILGPAGMMFRRRKA